MPYVAVGVVLDEVNLIVEVFFDDGLQLCVKFLNLLCQGVWLFFCCAIAMMTTAARMSTIPMAR